jgi:hypothetical protein
MKTLAIRLEDDIHSLVVLVPREVRRLRADAHLPPGRGSLDAAFISDSSPCHQPPKREGKEVSNG